MKVIKKGNTIKEITCHHCGCIFEYCKKDIETFDTYRLAEDDIRYLVSYSFVLCPECESSNIISTKECD